MTRKEREQLKNEISIKNTMTRKIGAWSRNSFFVFLLTFALTLWGFGVFNDNFIEVSEGMRSIIKWISLILAIGSGGFTVLSFLSFRNSKKHVLSLIAKLDNK